MLSDKSGKLDLLNSNIGADVFINKFDLLNLFGKSSDKSEKLDLLTSIINTDIFINKFDLLNLFFKEICHAFVFKSF